MQKTYEIRHPNYDKVICTFTSDKESAKEIFRNYWQLDNYIIYCTTDKEDVTEYILL